MTTDTITAKQLARQEVITEYLKEVYDQFKTGLLSVSEATIRLKVAEEMEDLWTMEDSKQNDSPFDSVSDAEADYS